ncbi:MAG: phospholipase D-like domain-containing protein [Kofleriaceae bacterium]
MALARTLVELGDLLAKRTDLDLFAPGARSRVAMQPEAARLLPQLQSATGSPEAAATLLLQALLIQRTEAQAREVQLELVATIPWGAPGLARPTTHVIREMLRAPRTSVVIVGYEISDREVLGLLVDLARSGTRITFICDRNQGSATEIRAFWPHDLAPPTIYQDEPRPDALKYASMHSKTLLVDQNDLLITSANFTLHGLRGNIELGLRVQGAVAAEVGKILDHLVWSGLVVSA